MLSSIVTLATGKKVRTEPEPKPARPVREVSPFDTTGNVIAFEGKMYRYYAGVYSVWCVPNNPVYPPFYRALDRERHAKRIIELEKERLK
ncbi:hypothetical protein GTB64_004547 [Salmonella enterica]|nr:hypothetical protein [Salmonella enterica]